MNQNENINEDRILKEFLKRNTFIRLPEKFTEKVLERIEFSSFKDAIKSNPVLKWKLIFAAIGGLFILVNLVNLIKPHFFAIENKVQFELPIPFALSYDLLFTSFSFLLLFWGLFALNKLLSLIR